MSKVIALFLGIATALHVVQILDSVILEKDEFIQLNNFNEANFVSQDEGAFNQTITIGVTNNFENFKFDMFIFEVNEDGTSEDLECYRNAVHHKNWNVDCDFGNKGTKVEIYKNIDHAEYILKSATESNDKDKFVVIDNTPLPQGGAQASDTIILEYACSSNY